MADINIDINLPNPISADITSPTQALSSNIFIPGPQGLKGEKGDSTSVNDLTAGNIIISGLDGNTVLNSGTNTIFISGNSGYFESRVNILTSNLNSTGANLISTINNLSGDLQNQISNLDNIYATDTSLASTGSTLQTNINTVFSNLILTGNNLEGKINSLSGNVVLLIGNQNISGTKTFSGEGAVLNFTSGARLLVSGVSVLTGIQDNYPTFSQLNRIYRNLYISLEGNDSTAQIGNINRPYLTAQHAWNSIWAAWGINPNPIDGYVLNFYSNSSPWTIDIGTRDWPEEIQIRGLNYRHSPYSATTLNITHTIPVSSSSRGKNFTIRDLGDRSIILNITSQGATYAGGVQMDGGDGGNITIFNGRANTIITRGGNGGGNSSRIGGRGGSISLYNSDVSVITSEGGQGGFGNNTFRGGGNIYVENSKISSSINYNTDPVNTSSITIINSIYSSLPTNPNSYHASKRVINSYNSSTQNSVLSLSIPTGAAGIRVNHQVAINDNNNLSGIFNNLTLHDNQDRPHLAGRDDALTIDFASGVYFNNSNIYVSGTGSLILSNPIGIPLATGSSGTRGTILWDAQYLYVCIDNNSWKRTQLNTW